MDFKRTQILLLVFFIFFDAYLAFTLITKQQVRQTNSGQVTNVSSSKTVTLKSTRPYQMTAISCPLLRRKLAKSSTRSVAPFKVRLPVIIMGSCNRPLISHWIWVSDLIAIASP